MLGICYGMQLIARELGGEVAGRRGRGVRPLAAERSHQRRAAGGDAGGADLLDVAPRHGVRARRRVRRARVARPLRRWRRSSPVERGIYGIQFHPEVVHTPYGQQVLTNFLREVCGCERHLERALGDRGADRGDPRAGRGLPRDLRPLGRRRFERRGAARAPRDRRSADLRVRRPRPDAQERGRAGVAAFRDTFGVPLVAVDAVRSVPRAAEGGHRPRGEAQADRRRVHPRVRGGGRQARTASASSSRARCTRT